MKNKTSGDKCRLRDFYKGEIVVDKHLETSISDVEKLVGNSRVTVVRIYDKWLKQWIDGKELEADVSSKNVGGRGLTVL